MEGTLVDSLKRLFVPLPVALLVLPLALAHSPMGTPKPYREPVSEWSLHEYGPPAQAIVLGPRLDGWALGDGHKEFAAGGAYILVVSGNGFPSSDPNVGAGSVFCHGEAGHHDAFGSATVEDFVLGADASITIAADSVDSSGMGGGCGDGVPDVSEDCIGSCTVWFPPGLDGAYRVYVSGTGGHVYWP